jgi:hypothetical protein
MMNDVFINRIEGTVRRAQAYATIYEQVGFKPFYLADFNEDADYERQISPSMIAALHRFHLVRRTGNRRECDIYLGEWNGIKHIKKGYSYEWQLEFDSRDSTMLSTEIWTIMLQLKELYGSITEAHVEAFNMLN